MDGVLGPLDTDPGADLKTGSHSAGCLAQTVYCDVATRRKWILREPLST